MDSASTTLQAPKTGRSRFSKALPAPPRGLDDDTASIPRVLQQFSFPQRKDSVSTATSASRSVKTEHIDSPLPALPAKVDASQMKSPKNVIPRRPVGQPAQKSNKMKRVSSISSLLSAYSNGSGNSVNRSSQETILTKDSSPSHSQGREGVDKSEDLANILKAYSINPYADDSPSSKDDELNFPLPPSLSSPNVITQPGTPQGMRPSLDTTLPAVVSTSSPVSLTNESPKQEIWRRRAGSKSELGIAVPELKLAVSHGSTAATVLGIQEDVGTQNNQTQNSIPKIVQTSGGNVQLRPALSLDTTEAPPQPPQKELPRQPQPPQGSSGVIADLPQIRPTESISTVFNNPATTIPISSTPEPSSTQASQKGNENKTSILPPRLASLPGRNIRPRQQEASENDKMIKAREVNQRKELARVTEPSNDAPKDFLKVSRGPEHLQKTFKGLPVSPRMDAQPARSPALDTPKNQQIEQNFPRTPKDLPQSPLNAQKSVTQATKSPAPTSTPPSLPSPDAPPRLSETPAAQAAAGAGAALAASQPNPQLRSDSADRATGLRRPIPESPGVSDPSSRAAGVRPARSQHDFGASTMSSNYSHSKQNSASRRVSPTTNPAYSRDPIGGAQGALQVEPNVQWSTTPSPAGDNSDYLDIVKNFNNSDISTKDFALSPPSGSKGLRARPALSPLDRPLSQIREVPKDSAEEVLGRAEEERVPVEELSKELNEALALFQRGKDLALHKPAATTASGGVCPPKPLGREHYGCWTNHEIMVPTRNESYSLACQACGTEERSPRKLCSWCRLRVCYGCADTLAQNGRSLERAMEVIKARKRPEKGKEAAGGY